MPTSNESDSDAQLALQRRAANGAPDIAPNPTWRAWWICGLLFLATMLMYLDRQTLAQTISRISDELALNNEQYGWIEFGFGMAFAAGALFWGLIADRVNIRWLYPTVLLGWSLAGVATAWGPIIGNWLALHIPGVNSLAVVGSEATSFQAWLGILFCRVMLGFFEAGHWPCALITTQRLLDERNRTLGNSVLQSGATIGALLTPPIVGLLMTDAAGSWRWPFVVVGVLGMSWILPWWLSIGGSELRPVPKHAQAITKAGSFPWRNFIVLLAVVIPINMTWQFFRAWLPKMLQGHYGYGEEFVLGYTTAFYLTADVGCLAVGAATAWLGRRGWSPHQARVAGFATCTVLAMTTLLAAVLPKGPALLLVFLIVGAGTLGLFPTYYSLSQQLSKTKQGAVTGSLGATTWVATSVMQAWIGKSVDATHSYGMALSLVGLVPLIACLAIVCCWREETH
jgi:ACS family hexuronate transporter-like MFS transporter